MPIRADWKAMTPRAREAFDQERIGHHGAFGPIVTPAMKRVHTALSLQADVNFHHPSGARPGSVIDGAANIGKTTIVTQFGRRYELALRKRYPSGLTEAGDEFIPVLYVSLASGTTVKGLSAQMLDFYGYPQRRQATQVELTMHVKKAALRCQTTLAIFDDIHYLRVGNQSDREVNDHLKHLASVVPATFVYAGIDCEQGGLLREGKGRMDTRAFSQTGSRFSLHAVDTFRIDNAQGAKDWIALLGGLERELLLLDGSEGMLSGRLSRYLFDRTHGEIGSLMSLLRQGALIAIKSGAERISSALLDGITLSYDAEAESQRRGRTGAPNRSQGRARQKGRRPAGVPATSA